MKRLICALTLICLLLVIPLQGFGAGAYYMIDEAEYLTEEQRITLEDMANSISAASAIDCVVLIVDSLNGKTAQEYADDYYDYNGYYEDGLLFLLALQEREMHISTCGKVINHLNDQDISDLCDTAAVYFSEDKYYEGLYAYLVDLPEYFEPEADISLGAALGVLFVQSLPVGAIVALVVILIMRSLMNTKHKQNSADSYMADGSYALKVNQDLFLYSRVNKTPRQQSSSSSSGSGTSVHTSSSGRSHGGGGRKF